MVIFEKGGFILKKSVFSLAIILVLLAGILSGCSPAEKGMQSYYQEMSSIDRYENAGEISVGLNALPQDANLDTKDLALVKTTLNKFSITFQGKVDMDKQIMTYDFFLKDKSTGSTQELTTVIISGNTIYIKVSGLIKLMSLMGESNLDKNLTKAFGGADYLAIPMDQFSKEMLPAGKTGIGMWGPGSNLLDQSKKQQDLILKLVSGLSDQVLDQYESGLVVQNGSQYVFSVSPANGVECFKSLVIYTINNAEKLGNFLTNTLTNMPDEEMKSFGLDPTMRSQYVMLIQAGISDISANRSQYLTEINGLGKEETDEFIKMFDGSHYTLSIAKKGSQSYESGADIRLVVSDPQKPSDKMDLSINAASTLSACPEFTVTVPSTGVTTWAEVEKRISQVMKVQTTSGAFKLTKGTTQTQGKIGVKIIKNYTYLQLRAVATALNEEVSWNGTAHRAYVERLGSKIDMTGTVINGRTYIKIRDFEKLGYQIQWDAKTKTVTIIKKSLF